MKTLIVLLAVSAMLSGCGGVMDYMSRPVDVRGDLIKKSTAAEPSVVIATPTIGRSSEQCAELIAKGTLNQCMAQKIPLGPNGTFQAAVPGSMRGCAFLIIPPLLNLFCDEKSYLVIAVPTDPADVYAVVISSGKAKLSRIKGTGTSQVTISQVGEEPNKGRAGDAKKKDTIAFHVELQ